MSVDQLAYTQVALIKQQKKIQVKYCLKDQLFILLMMYRRNNLRRIQIDTMFQRDFTLPRASVLLLFVSSQNK